MERAYEGGELGLFREAKRWKAYWSAFLAPWLRGDVLEIGAGIGTNTAQLFQAGHRWTCVEPDPGFCEVLRGLGLPIDVICGTSADLGDTRYDTALYLDALEHIEDDAGELRRVAARLRPGGHLVVLAPAHQRLFSPFDRHVGHYRRYDAAMLRAIAPPGVDEVRVAYLDSAGLLASAANRLILAQSLPTPRQIATWDRWLVPVSTGLDPWLGHRVGKTVIAVWRAR
jgi:SAM-dependent methyltransferase